MRTKKYYICVTPFFPSPANWRGAYVYDQVKAIMRNSDYEVVVFKTSNIGSREQSYVLDGIQVYTLPTLFMPSYILNGLTEGILGKCFLYALHKNKIDIQRIAFVHCHTANHAAFGLALKKINPSVKVLVQFHDLDPLTIRNGKWADKRWNSRYRARKSINAINKADLLICISEPVRDALLSFPRPRVGEVYESALRILDNLADFEPVHPKNVYVLNNGVDISLFTPLDNLNMHKDIFKIGCVANFQELKDHQTLLEAFCHLINKGYTNMRLSLLGTGSTRSAIESYINEHKLAEYVEWPEEVPHAMLPKYYRSLDLFVLPSFYEGFGCVYTEAYACGVPFMGCYNQGAAECIVPEDKDLWLIEPRNALQLASRIENYYHMRPRQRLCKPYDINVLIKDFLEYLSRTF